MSPTTVEGDEIAGFNSQISFRQFKFHVQTEDSGELVSPTVNTLVFLSGALVHKQSTRFEMPTNTALRREQLNQRIREQHLALLARVERGEFVPRP